MFIFKNKLRGRRLVKVLLIMLSGVAVSGCDIVIISELYSRDIFADKSLTFPSQLKIQIPSCSQESIHKFKPKVLALFDSRSKPSIANCEDGISSFLVVDFVAEIAGDTSSYDFIMFREVINAGKTVILRPTFSDNFISQVNALLSEQLQSLDYDDLTFTFNIHNDGDGAISYHASGWINGKPRKDYRGEIGRRQKISLRSSDLISALILENEQPAVIILYSDSQ